MTLSAISSRSVRIFYSYAASASRDKNLFKKIETYLIPSMRQGLIDQSDIDEADIIVLLISPDYFASERCAKVEMERALERGKAGEALLIPVLLSYPAEWESSPLRTYEILPSDHKPIKTRSSIERDNALLDVSNGILKVVKKRTGATGAHSRSEKQSHLNTIFYRHSPFFTDREEILTSIHTYFTSLQAFQHPLALSGMPGCGKTQLAVEYAHLYRKEYQDILWLDASSHHSLKEAIITLAEPLSFLEEDRKDDQHLCGALKRWLEQHDRWLLILDTISDFSLMDLFIPPQYSGHVLLTTCSQAAGDMAHPIAVTQMIPENSALFLLRRARIIGEQALLSEASPTVYAQAADIVQEFDGLALALDQAGAYIEETKCGLAGYHKLYREYGPALLAQRGKRVRTHPDSVTATLLLSFKAVDREYPVALELLCLLAFLHPDTIPREMIKKGASALDGPLRVLAAETDALDKAIAALLEYSLVRFHADPTMLSIHRVIQAILIEDLMPRERHRWAIQAVRLMNRAFPEPAFKNWPACERYFSQARRCAEHIASFQLTQKEAAHLLQHLGTYCYQRAYYQDAGSYLTTALHLYEQAKKPDRPAMAQTLNNLGLLSHKQGKYQKAKAFYQAALEIRKQVYGPEHETIAQTLNNLALLYKDEGKFQEAEALYQDVLHIDERTVGLDHPDRATALSNLAELYEEQGKYDRAEELYQQVFSIEERSLDADHPHRVVNLIKRAEQYERQDRYIEAEELYQQALDIRIRTVGADHPDTAESFNSLAGVYETQHQYEEAEALYRRALSIYQHRYGQNHPDTATILHNLGYLLCQQGRYQEAEALYQQALTITESILGPDHLDLATILQNLGTLYHLLGDNKHAESLLRRALSIRERTLGLEHPDSCQSLSALVDLLLRQRLYEQAEPLYSRLLNITRQAHGPESSDAVLQQEQYTLLLERINEAKKDG